MKLLLLIYLGLLPFASKLFAQPSNDDPCNAISIPVNKGDILGQNCIPSTDYAWTGATLTGATPNPSCITGGQLNNIRDVWYSLSVPSSGKINIAMSSAQQMYLLAYGPATCTSTIGFSEISCFAYRSVNSIEMLTLASLTPGSTVYLRIMKTTEMIYTDGNIRLCVTEPLNIPAIDNSSKVGVGTPNPLAKLDVAGTAIIRDSLLVAKNIETRANLKASTIQVTNAAGNGKVLQSDADGKASWVSPSMIGAGVHYVGEFYGGGVVFYVYDGGQHGLIAPPADYVAGAHWNNNGIYTITNTFRDGVRAGMYNTQLIISSQGNGIYAALQCSAYEGNAFGDWYLPSKFELNLLYLQKDIVRNFGNTYYWSSNEFGTFRAWEQDFTNGSQISAGKEQAANIRPIRAF